MSLLNWFSSRKKHDAEPPLSVMSSGLSRMESTKPFHAARNAGGSAQPANRKQERMARRELLYAVVREAMVRAGVLSSGYKFKVLSLDPRGQQFLVMVDLAGPASTTRLAEIEAMIAQSAKQRYDVLVTAVYWRANDHVAVGDPAHSESRPAPLQAEPRRSRPAPLQAEGRSSRPAPLQPEGRSSRPAPLQAEPRSSRPVPLQPERRPARGAPFEPLQDDEVDAFRKALDAGVRGEQALADANQGKPAAPGASYTLLTGFEDTEMVDNNVNEHLSGTQWGTLR
jgi:hypothetical protein